MCVSVTQLVLANLLEHNNFPFNRFKGTISLRTKSLSTNTVLRTIWQRETYFETEFVCVSHKSEFGRKLELGVETLN